VNKALWSDIKKGIGTRRPSSVKPFARTSKQIAPTKRLVVRSLGKGTEGGGRKWGSLDPFSRFVKKVQISRRARSKRRTLPSRGNARESTRK